MPSPRPPQQTQSLKNPSLKTQSLKTDRATPSQSLGELPKDRFINRELSWLEFNKRVLQQAADASLPLLERSKFLAITSSNLDEFVMVRVGSLKMQFTRNAMQRDPSGMTISEQLEAVSARCHDFVAQQDELFRYQLEPMMKHAGIEHIELKDCSPACTDAADDRFHREVMAVLSPQPMRYDLPFPLMQGLGIHVAVRLKPNAINSLDAPEDQEEDFYLISMGRALPRMVWMPSSQGRAYLLLEELVLHHIEDFFPGREVIEAIAIRITRNADVELREDEAFDLMDGMEEVLESRRQSHPVRMEYSAGASDPMLAFLSEKMHLRSQDLFAINGPLDLTYLFALHGLSGFESLKDEAWPAQSHPEIDPAKPVIEAIRERDLLLVHPYEHFDPVVRLIEEAAVDPEVLAIKQVLYRTSRNSPIVAALMRAAQHGKYVSVIVELKARFDEARNIEWAREMEHSGVQVIYGIQGLKTHAKVCIIVRREPTGIVRYLHFGTGNYNEATASLYSDISVLTCNKELGNDATAFFTCITGGSQPQTMQKLSAAPLTLRQRILDLIEGERRRSLQGQKGEIVAKLNALVDNQIIDALYRASQAGVKILLNIRGICCLKPGIKGLSETIQVISIVDRYLEHARIFEFRHGGDRQILISSADWMPRNLDRRLELLVPIEDEKCQAKLHQTLHTYFHDNTNAWVMKPDGKYNRESTSQPEYRAQWILYQEAYAAKQAMRQSQRTRFQTHEPKRD